MTSSDRPPGSATSGKGQTERTHERRPVDATGAEREPGEYVAGADGTQTVQPPTAEDAGSAPATPAMAATANAAKSHQPPRDQTVKEIERERLKEKIDRHDPMVLLETLAPEQFKQTHLPGALNMPPDRVEQLASVLVPDKTTQVITYCAGPKCPASLNVARELSALGYSDVWHYAGGKQDWTMAGLPVENG